MQQAIPKHQSRQTKPAMARLASHFRLAGTLAAELLALASMATALTAGFLFLITLLPT